MWHSEGHFSLDFTFLFCKSMWVVSMSFTVKRLLLLEHIMLFPVSVRTFSITNSREYNINSREYNIKYNMNFPISLGKKRTQCFSTIPLLSPPKIQGQTNLASDGRCHQFWVTLWLLASPLVLSPFADSLCSPFSDCYTLCPHPSPPDSAALKPWMFEQCSRTWLSLPHIRSVPTPELIPAGREMRCSDSLGWGHVHPCGWRGSWLNPWYMEGSEKGVFMSKKNYVRPWYWKKGEDTVEGSGERHLLWCVYASSSCWLKEFLFLVTVVNPCLSFKF